MLFCLFYLCIAALLGYWGRNVAMKKKRTDSSKKDALLGILSGVFLQVLGVLMLYLMPDKDA